MKKESHIGSAVSQALGIIIGSILITIAFVFFITPYDIIPGGVYGLAIIIHNFLPQYMVGTIGLTLNIPLLILSFWLLGKGYGTKTVITSLFIPIIMNTATYLVGGTDPTTILGGAIDLSDDILLSSLFGGLLLGCGGGLIIKNRSTSGGTDVISLVVSKFTHIPYAKVMLCVESTVVLCGLIALGSWKLPLYSLVTIMVASKMIDLIVDGASTDKLLFIISDKKTEVKEYILKELNRGGTIIKASGMYSDNSKDMVFVVVSRNQLPIIKHNINSIDPESFITIVNANEIMGKGFKPFTPS